MPDREKVIKGIEHCIGDDCNGDKWSECEYSGHGCIDALLKDALALLKAQEPVKRKPYDSFDYLCGNCNRVISRRYDYCPWCGRAVKRDG